MKHSIWAVFIALLFLAGCKKDKTIITTGGPGTGKLTLLKGDNQSGTFGELLHDTLQLKISSANPDDHFKITYALIQGNGMVEQAGNYPFTLYIIDTAMTLRLLWRMGCDNTQQKIRFYIYTDNTGGIAFTHPPSDSITISASAVKPNGWCRACGYGMSDIYNPKIITPDNTNLYFVNKGLFKSTDGGLNWYKVNGIPYSDDIMDAQFNSNHWLYILTNTHGIYYTQDMQQWTAINNGILDMRTPTGFLVEDTALFVSFYFDGPYRTSNNGGFWRKLLVGGGSQRFYLFKRHPSGKVILVDDWGDVKVSDTNGDTWNNTSLPVPAVTSIVNDIAVAPDGSIYVGGNDATISAYDAPSGTNSVHSYYQYNGSSQHVNNITIAGNDVYYLVNYSPAAGIYRKNNNWGPVDVGFSNRIDFYYLKSNGAFLVHSKEWLYYHH